MKALITGGKGQLAGEIAKVLSVKGWTVVSKSRQEMDITDFVSVKTVVSSLKPDFVFNCAAYNDVDGAEADWQSAFMVNGIGVKYLSMACSENKAVFVHFSSDYVFDGTKKEPYSIADFPNPINKYGQSKLLGEDMVRFHADRFFLIRTSWVFGEGKFSFPGKILGWANRHDEIKIVDDQFSCPSYAADVAKTLADIIETDNYGLYHVTNTGVCSRYEWAKYILDKIGWKGSLYPAKSSDFSSPARRPEYSALDSFPLKETIGYTLPRWQDATDRFLKEIL